MKIILATSSENRINFFKNLGFKFKIKNPTYEENIIKNKDAPSQAIDFSLGKAQSVFKNCTGDNFCILGFDSMASFMNQSIGKPKNIEDAFQQIKNFSGHSHFIYSAITLIGKYKGVNFLETGYEKTEIVIKSNLSDNDIKNYLMFNQWRGKCGSYSMMQMGLFLAEEINGSVPNVLGIPTKVIQEKLEKICKKSIFEIVEK